MGLLYVTCVTVTRSLGVEYKCPSHLCLRFPACGVAKPLAVRAVTSVVVSHRAEPVRFRFFWLVLLEPQMERALLGQQVKHLGHPPLICV